MPQEVVDAIAATRARGGRVIAVGTTSVRSLESAAKVTLAQGKPLAPFFSDTDIFIFPVTSSRWSMPWSPTSICRSRP